MTQKKLIRFISKSRGDITIAANGKEYPIYSIEGEEIIHQEYGAGSHGPFSIRNDVIGKLQIGSYLNAEEIKSLNNAIEFPEPFEIRITRDKIYKNCTKGAVYRGYGFEFSGHF